MSCDHKFVDSKRCLKCGWAPPPRRREQVDDVQFIGPKGTVFVWLREQGQVSVFARGATIGVLGGRSGWHQEVPIEDVVAVGAHAKARWL